MKTLLFLSIISLSNLAWAASWNLDPGQSVLLKSEDVPAAGLTVRCNLQSSTPSGEFSKVSYFDNSYCSKDFKSGADLVQTVIRQIMSDCRSAVTYGQCYLYDSSIRLATEDERQQGNCGNKDGSYGYTYCCRVEATVKVRF